MAEVNEIRSSLEVGFPEGKLPEDYVRYRGRQVREIPLTPEFPFEDSQFEVVMMAGDAVSQASVKEAHRVLRPAGRLYFTVPEKTKKQAGFSMPDVYSIVRYGFDIIDVTRPKWWYFGLRGRTISIVARKKNWRELNNTFRPYL